MTEKKKNTLKMLFGTESLIEISRKIISTIVIVAFSVPGVSFVLKKSISEVVQEEISPINQYIVRDIEKLIDKNLAKIKEDPEDLKIIDVESAIESWEFFKDSNIKNKAIMQEKIEMLKLWYRQNGA